MLEVKFEWKVNRIIDDIIEYGNAAAAAIWETLYLQPEELSENEIISKKEKSGCDKKDKDSPGEQAGKTLHMKATPGVISQHWNHKG